MRLLMLPRLATCSELHARKPFTCVLDPNLFKLCIFVLFTMVIR
jgi:hypothetical protein